MRLLLDSHSLIWAADEPGRLSSAAAAAIQDVGNERFISAVSAWEIAIKCGLGKLSLSAPYRQWMDRALTDLAASLLPVALEHAEAQISLPKHHRDPFDRMLVAQAKVEGMLIVSTDATFDHYGVARVW